MLKNVEYLDVYNSNNNIHVFVTHFSIFFVVKNICGYYDITYGCLCARYARLCLVWLCVVWWGAQVGGCFSFRRMTDLLYKLFYLDNHDCLC